MALRSKVLLKPLGWDGGFIYSKYSRLELCLLLSLADQQMGELFALFAFKIVKDWFDRIEFSPASPVTLPFKTWIHLAIFIGVGNLWGCLCVGLIGRI